MIKKKIEIVKDIKDEKLKENFIKNDLLEGKFELVQDKDKFIIKDNNDKVLGKRKNFKVEATNFEELLNAILEKSKKGNKAEQVIINKILENNVKTINIQQ